MSEHSLDIFCARNCLIQSRDSVLKGFPLSEVAGVILYLL